MRHVRHIRDHGYVNAQRLFAAVLKSVSRQIFSSLQIQQSVLTIAEIYSFQLDAQRIWRIMDYRIFIHACMGLRGQQTKGLLCYNPGGLNFLEICSEGTLIAFDTVHAKSMYSKGYSKEIIIIIAIKKTHLFNARE